VVNFIHQSLYTPGKNARAIEQEVGLTPYLFWTFQKRESLLVPAKVSVLTNQLVA
jgi:hypothetical protein